MSQSGQFRLTSAVGGDVNTLKGNSGGFVGPDGGGNINVIGDGTTIDVVGTPGTNTLTITALGDVAIDFTADDANTASPSGGNLNIFGSTNITTLAPGSADTIQINLNTFILWPNSDVVGESAIFINGIVFMHAFGASGGTLDDNTFLGSDSGNFVTTTQASTGIGAAALGNISSGIANTAVGAGSMPLITTGQRNTALGFNAGNALTGGDSFNICIFNQGVVGDNGVTRIGTDGDQTDTYVAGIFASTIDTTHEVVFVDGDGKLGTPPSTDGQLIIGSAAGSPNWATMTSIDGSVDITLGSNTIDLSTTGGTVYTLTTNNDTPTPLITHTIAANSAVAFNVTIVAVKSDFSESLWGSATFGGRRAGGGAIAVEDPVVAFADDSTGSPLLPALGVDDNGNDIRLMAIGEAAATWKWKATAIIITQT